VGTTGRRSTRRTTGRSGRELTVQQGWTQGPGFDHPPKPYRFGAFCPVRGVIQVATASEDTPVTSPASTAACRIHGRNVSALIQSWPRDRCDRPPVPGRSHRPARGPTHRPSPGSPRRTSWTSRQPSQPGGVDVGLGAGGQGGAHCRDLRPCRGAAWASKGAGTRRGVRCSRKEREQHEACDR